jgi:hypothetical protein
MLRQHQIDMRQLLANIEPGLSTVYRRHSSVSSHQC